MSTADSSHENGGGGQPPSQAVAGREKEDRLKPCPDCDQPISKLASACPNCGRPLLRSSGELDRRRYPALRIIASICKFFAILTPVLCLLAILALLGSSAGGWIIFTLFFHMFLTPLFLWAYAELLLLLIDVEWNTRILRPALVADRENKVLSGIVRAGGRAISLGEFQAWRSNRGWSQDKMSEELRFLSENADDELESVDCEFREIRVRRGLVQVEVVLRRWDEAEIESLKAIGFVEIRRTKWPKTLIGTVPVRHLAELAEIENVKSVVQYTYYGEV